MAGSEPKFDANLNCVGRELGFGVLFVSNGRGMSYHGGLVKEELPRTLNSLGVEAAQALGFFVAY